MTNNKRIFIGPHEIAGYYRNLALGMKVIGVDFDYITFTNDPMSYGGQTKKPRLLRLAKWFNQFRGNTSSNLFIKATAAIAGELLRILWGITAICRYDAFIFGFGHSLFRNNLDLPLLYLLGKKIIINVSHGSELRPPYIDGAYQSDDGVCRPTVKELYELTASHKRRIRLFERYASYIIGAPFPSTQLSSKRLINLWAIGLPCWFREPPSLGLAGKNVNSAINDVDRSFIRGKSTMRILHAPSHPACKGSDVISKSIENLKAKGFEIEYILLKGRSNDEVLKEIECCDFVVDQVYSDHPMAGFATEAAWFGKPAVVGGYGFDYLRRFFNEGMFPPSKTCHPSEIEAAIEELIVRNDFREQLGRQAQEFVHSRWSAEQVAKRFCRLIDGNIPVDWWLDPDSVVYLHGCGQTDEQTRRNIRELVAAYGVGALGLSHRPQLERAFLEFAEIET